MERDDEREVCERRLEGEGGGREKLKVRLRGSAQTQWRNKEGFSGEDG